MHNFQINVLIQFLVSFNRNLTEIKFTKEEAKLLNLGFQFNIEKPLTTHSTNLIIEDDNAIKLLDTKFRVLATKQLKQNLNSNNSYNILHKRQLYVMKQLEQELPTPPMPPHVLLWASWSSLLGMAEV